MGQYTPSPGVKRPSHRARLRRLANSFQKPGSGIPDLRIFVEGKTVETDTTYAMAVPDQIVLVTCGSSSLVVTLPPVAAYKGVLVQVKKVDADSGQVTVQRNAVGEDIDGESSIIITHYQGSLTLMGGDGVWHLVGRIEMVPTQDEASRIVNNTDYTVSSPIQNIWVTTGASTRTITLPNTRLYQSTAITIKKVDNGAGAVTVSAPAIDAGNTFTLTNQWDAVTLVANSFFNQWMVVNSYP